MVLPPLLATDEPKHKQSESISEMIFPIIVFTDDSAACLPIFFDGFIKKNIATANTTSPAIKAAMYLVGINPD